MKGKTCLFILCFGLLVCAAWRATHVAEVHAQTKPAWPQWARTPQHTGSTHAVGQSPNAQLADIIFDPFVSQEQAEEYGELLSHYQVPLVDGDRVFLEIKTGTYVSCNPPGSGQPYPCGPDAWNQEIWNERAFAWHKGTLVQLWNAITDWKPEPNSGAGGSGVGLYGWEPVFHSVMSNGYVFVPGFSGSIYKVKQSDGKQVAHYSPFGNDANTFVSGPLTVDRQGNVYYNALALDATNPWTVDVRGAYLVKVTPKGAVRMVSFATLVQGTPDCGDPSQVGSQRPGVNVAPAISADGKTIYTVSRSHFYSEYACMEAVQADLKPIWHTSFQLSTLTGTVSDLASSTPSVAPDGSILFGTTSDSSSRGNMLKFSSSGQFLASYDFGWDETPAIYAHGGTYSVIIKDNYYGTGGPYYITQLSADLVPEWQYQSADNYEWCVNAPAVDANGTVYADSEDGSVFVINQGGTLKGKLFLLHAVGAAYTPIALGRDGKIYTENDGHMFVVGN
jgi:hypothetical protein